jgi:hypothetical protein
VGFIDAFLNPKYYGSHLKDASVFLTGVLSVLLFVVFGILAGIKTQHPAFLIAAIINATPFVAFVCFWLWLSLAPE